jgi:hypothetical protein
MRHAVVVTHLMNRARTAAAEADQRRDVDAPAEPPARERHPGRLASLFRRARVRRAHGRALGFRTESPGGGA